MNQPRFSSTDTERRDCSLYYIDTLDPATNYTTVRRNAYVGETGREPFLRFMEHLYNQPFGDVIVGKPRLDPRVFTSKAQVLAAEEEAIKRLKPIWNYEHNLDNPRRIPIPEARRQRAARDAAKGVVVPWAPPPDARPAREPARKTRPARRRRRYPRPVRRLGIAAASWAPSTLLGWVGAWRIGVAPWLGLRAAALLVAVLVLGVWWLLPRRKWDGMVAGVVAAGAVLLLLGTVASAVPHQAAGRQPVPAATRHR